MWSRLRTPRFLQRYISSLLIIFIKITIERIIQGLLNQERISIDVVYAEIATSGRVGLVIPSNYYTAFHIRRVLTGLLRQETKYENCLFHASSYVKRIIDIVAL